MFVKSANTTATSVLKKNIFAGIKFVEARISRQPRPLYLSHMVTQKCDAGCPYCYWNKNKDSELSLTEIRKLHIEAKKSGFILNHIWGGEPLLRKDINEIVISSAETGFLTSLVTNGSNLTKNHSFVQYLDLLIVSLDAPDERHDKIRNHKGLFKKAIDGIEKVKSLYPEITLNICCVLSTLNKGVIPDMINLAQKYGAQIFFCPVGDNPTINNWPDQDKVRKNYQKTKAELIEDFKLIREYKKDGYPIQSSMFFLEHYINGGGAYPCFRPRVYLNIYANGNVETCFKGIFANIKEKSISDIVKSQDYIDSVKKGVNCKAGCHANDAIELSGLWRCNYRSLLNWV